MTMFWTEILPTMPATMPYHLTDYGDAFQHGKHRIIAEAQALNATPAQQALLVAMAQIESTRLCCDARDTSKDGYPSENVSMWNLSVDLVHFLGYPDDAPMAALNCDENSPVVIELLLNGFRSHGYVKILDFVRGGRTAYNDGYSYGAYEYRNTVATNMRLFDAHPELLTDGRRIEINLAHV